MSSHLVSASLVLTLAVASLAAAETSAQPSCEDLVAQIYDLQAQLDLCNTSLILTEAQLDACENQVFQLQDQLDACQIYLSEKDSQIEDLQQQARYLQHEVWKRNVEAGFFMFTTIVAAIIAASRGRKEGAG